MSNNPANYEVLAKPHFRSILDKYISAKGESRARGRRLLLFCGLPFERTIGQTTKTMPLAQKQHQLLHYEDKWNYKLTGATTLKHRKYVCGQPCL